MTIARFDFRLDAEVKRKVEKASALTGASTVTEYVIKVIEADATRVIEQHQSMVIEFDLFDRFMTACDKAAGPNKALRDAKSYADAHDFE
ncbi:MAG: hypothetical protein PsegKO_00730 [Pseudohongiellaceae bacterium]|jgi:uncharacterized protein (DUF1778 family)